MQDLCLKSPVTHGNFCQQMSKLAALPMALCLVNAHVPLRLVNAYVPTNLSFAAVPCKFLMKRSFAFFSDQEHCKHGLKQI